VSDRPVDRRALLTGAAAAVVGATAVGRLVATRAGAGDAPPAAAPSPSADPSRVPATPAGEVGTGPAASAAPSPAPSPSPSSSSSAAPALVVPVLCRDAWEARPPAGGFLAHELVRMTVHHTAVPLTDDRQAPARLRQHQRLHQGHGWPDIAYHLGVDRRGNRYELRPVAARGDTFTDYDPAGHLLVLAEGDFDRQQPTDAQLEALAELLAWGASAHGLATDTVSGHRDHAATSCPGDALYVRLADLRARAAELAGAARIEVRSICGEEGRAAVARIEAGGADG
jgi:hypothetical protein